MINEIFKKPPVRLSCSCICPYDVGNGPWIKSTLIVTWNLVQSITCLCLVYFPLAVYQQSELLYPLQCFFLSINLHNKRIKVNSTMVKKSTSECRPIDDSSVWLINDITLYFFNGAGRVNVNVFLHVSLIDEGTLMMSSTLLEIRTRESWAV